MVKYEYQNKGMDLKMAKNNTNNASVGKKQAEREARLKKAKRKKIIRICVIIGILVAIAGITLAVVFSVKACNDKKNGITQAVTYATIELGSYGNVVVRLDDKNAPQTVERFIKYAKNGKYEGLEFTSAENGCLKTDFEQDWTSIFGEFSRNGYNNNLSHKKGVISMLRDVDYNSGNGTFFFTTEDKSAELDKNYAAFGEITSGMDIIEKIAKDVAENDGSKPLPAVTKITLEEKIEDAR